MFGVKASLNEHQYVALLAVLGDRRKMQSVNLIYQRLKWFQFANVRLHLLAQCLTEGTLDQPLQVNTNQNLRLREGKSEIGFGAHNQGSQNERSKKALD